MSGFALRLVLPFGLLLLVLIPRLAQAADIRIIDSPLCRLSLSGDIVAGDADRLEQIVTQAGRDAHLLARSETSDGLRLCLDSPGGSLEEGARLAEYVFEAGIGTVLAPNARCFSACSWVFMLGHARGEEEAFINRRMHHSARLGFHAPRVDFGRDQVIPGLDAEGLLTSMNQAVATILRVSNARLLGMRPAIDADLIEEAFAHDVDGEGNATFFEIDSIDKAGRWRIDLFGFDWPERIDAVAAARACTSLTRWPAGRNANSPSVLPSFESMEALRPRLPADTDTDLIRVEGLDSGYFLHECIFRSEVSAHPFHEAAVAACGINQGRATTLGYEPCEAFTSDPSARLRSYPAIAIFPPETRLRDLPQEARDIAARVTQAADPRLHRACEPPVDRLRVVRVNEYVTLRRQPGFQADILARIPLGAQIQVAGAADFAGDPARVNQCRAACRAAGTARDRPAPDVAACYLDNTLWFPARHGGQEGFVAGRFLAE